MLLVAEKTMNLKRIDVYRNVPELMQRDRELSSDPFVEIDGELRSTEPVEWDEGRHSL